MTAAVITPVSVQQFDMPGDVHTGTATAQRRIKGLYLEGVKATADDWFNVSAYGVTDANIISYEGHTITPTGSAYVLETFTYDSDDGKLVLTSATPAENSATSRVVLYYFE